MAATRLIALHRNKGKTLLQTLTARTDYARNPEKTEKGYLVTGYECDPMTAAEEFLLTKHEYALTNGRDGANEVIAYQIRQSFKPGEVTPLIANEIGRETALRFTKGKHAFITATHTDRAHIHNHIIFNSTTLDGKRKFRDFHLSGLALQRVSDLVCLEHGLSVITPRPRSERPRSTVYPGRNPGLLLNVEKKLREKGKGYARWATNYNLKQIAKSLLFLRDHGFRSYEDLNSFTEKLTGRQEEILKRIRSSEARLRELTDLRNHILDYVKTKETYQEYRKSGYGSKFREEHREEITRHENAKKAFEDLNGRPVPKIKDINDEFQRILREKREAYTEYYEERKEAREALIVRENIRTLLTEPEEPREREEQSR